MHILIKTAFGCCLLKLDSLLIIISQVYQGEGSSKKKAKSEAAEKAVRALAAALFESLAERVAADGGLLVSPVDGLAPPTLCSSNPVPSVEASRVLDSVCSLVCLQPLSFCLSNSTLY